jgi:hypothetical protein
MQQEVDHTNKTCIFNVSFLLIIASQSYKMWYVCWALFCDNGDVLCRP